MSESLPDEINPNAPWEMLREIAAIGWAVIRHEGKESPHYLFKTVIEYEVKCWKISAIGPQLTVRKVDWRASIGGSVLFREAGGALSDYSHWHYEDCCELLAWLQKHKILDALADA